MDSVLTERCASCSGCPQLDLSSEILLGADIAVYTALQPLHLSQILSSSLSSLDVLCLINHLAIGMCFSCVPGLKIATISESRPVQYSRCEQQVEGKRAEILSSLCVLSNGLNEALRSDVFQICLFGSGLITANE